MEVVGWQEEVYEKKLVSKEKNLYREVGGRVIFFFGAYFCLAPTGYILLIFSAVKLHKKLLFLTELLKRLQSDLVERKSPISQYLLLRRIFNPKSLGT